MKKTLLTERFQQLAGIKSLYEIEANKNEYQWVDANRNSIPYFKDALEGGEDPYTVINNSGGSDLVNTIRAFGEYVNNTPEEIHHTEIARTLGDNAVAHLKHVYTEFVRSIGDANLRDELTKPAGDDQNSSVRADAVNFVNSLPDSKEYTHLVNNMPFMAVTKKIQDMMSSWLGSPMQMYIPFLIPYTLYAFDSEIWDNLDYSKSSLGPGQN